MGLGPSPQPGMALGPRGPCELCRKPMQAGCWCGYLSVSGDKLISPPPLPPTVFPLGKTLVFRAFTLRVSVGTTFGGRGIPGLLPAFDKCTWREGV